MHIIVNALIHVVVVEHWVTFVVKLYITVTVSLYMCFLNSRVSKSKQLHLEIMRTRDNHLNC